MAKVKVHVEYLGVRIYFMKSVPLPPLCVVCTDIYDDVFVFFSKPSRDEHVWLSLNYLPSLCFKDEKKKYVEVDWKESQRFYKNEGDTYREITEEEFNFLESILLNN